jgi:valyl-tRNA synthetase
MHNKLLKPYDPKATEDKIYKIWEKSGYFNPDKLPKSASRRNAKSFTIIMPPTNANGYLHAGHALVLTIEDIMTRYKRMRGYKTLWLPGLDHAGFETQVVYEKELEKQGRSRFKMPPEQLYKEIWDFTENNKKNIIEQTKKMGASCDWSRKKYTLDKDIVKIVCDTFKKMQNDGLVYKGKKIVNWCPKHQTSLSDLETTDIERTDKFYYLKYGPFTIATARPETKFGDKYIVVHPDDKRYKDFKHGQKIDLEWINGPVVATVIKDKIIDMDFGTGAMTITPWHDLVDFELSQRHNLEKEQIIDFYGRLLPVAGEFSRMKISEARPLIVEKLKSKGLLVKVDENYKHTVKTCYKCGTMIEPQIKDQWFVKMKPLAEPAIKAIKNDKIKFIPERFKKISLHWLNNIIDWNISRQIVWGIKIPDDPAGDVFDTWFSSGQWPFAVLMSGKKNDFKTFYPTSVMETAGEIIFFWVCRMIMFGLYKTGKIPFENVYLHGLVLDAHGKKMSKSKNNVINPLDITDKYGTDALRIGLVVGNTPGTPLALDENKIKGYKNFANKIWNAVRFVLSNCEDGSRGKNDKKYLSDFKKLKKEITKNMDNFKFYIAAEKIYHYFWHTFCDKIIEESKKEEVSKFVLYEIFKDCLKLLHPFMPFITEEIWSLLPKKDKSLLIIEKWPKI